MRLSLAGITRQRAGEIFARFGSRRVLVLGDCMLDHYVWGKVNRISPEAPVPVLEVESSTHTPGGAANVVHNLRSLGARTGIAGVIGADEAGQKLRDTLSSQGVDVAGLVVDATRPTTTKTRIIAHSQQLVRTDLERRDPVDADVARRLSAVAERDAQRWDALLLSDYNKGVLRSDIIDRFVDCAQRAGALVVAGPKPESLSLYRRVKVVALNQGEAAAAVGFPLRDPDAVQRAGRQILEQLEVAAVLITRGEHGMSLFEAHEPPYHVPALASEVYDVSGAGDTVVSVLTLALSVGASLPEAVSLANVAAAVVVRKVGTATTTCDEVLATLPA